MRHDPAIASIVIMLRELKMHGMAQAVAELAEQGAPAFDAAQPILSQLLKAETAEREVRSVAYQLKVARFPAYRDLAGFDFGHSEVNEALVRQLHRCEFLENANNVVLVGGPGTGKTHIATALGVQAIEHHHRRVRFFSTVELVNALEEEKAQGKPGQIAHRLAYGEFEARWDAEYLPIGQSWRRCVRLHRVLLQPDAPAFDARLSQSRTVRESSRSLGRCQRNRQQPSHSVSVEERVHDLHAGVQARNRAVCVVANPRNSKGYCCGLRLAAHPDPHPAPLRARS